MSPRRRAATVAATTSWVLHALAVFQVWRTASLFGRGGVIAWMDFPVSLAYLGLHGSRLLTWSLLAGGLQWAAIGGGLALLVGRAATRQRPSG